MVYNIALTVYASQKDPQVTTSGDNPDLARARSLAAWLREQPIPGRARAALLRDLRRVSEDPDQDEASALRGLDQAGFVAELHAPAGGAVAAVTGIGRKLIAALRRVISPDPGAAEDDATQQGETASPPAAEPDATQQDEAASQPAAEDDVQQDEATSTEPATGAPQGGEDTLAELVAAADGLLVPSESDNPFEPFRWEGSGPLTAEALVAHLGLPAETPVETRSLEKFFAPLSQSADWMDERERAQAARFGQLRELMAEKLRDPQVYRVGRTKIAVIIAGQDAAWQTVGLRTTVIET